MRTLLLTIVLSISTQVMSQDAWSQAELGILDNFGLQPEDPRGILFKEAESSCTGDVKESVRSAIETFFTATLKKDLTEFCIEGVPDELEGKPLDIHQIVRLYLNN